ncbi:MAG: hypothetical protein ACUZ8O_14930 [Candidatus Anammoxibacter sp.]
MILKDILGKRKKKAGITQEDLAKKLHTKKRLETYDTVSYNTLMKITALILDNLIEEVRDYTNGKTITESLIRVHRESLPML